MARKNQRAATEAIQAATADLIDVIEVLDGSYRFHFDGQPEMLARWLRRAIGPSPRSASVAAARRG